MEISLRAPGAGIGEYLPHPKADVLDQLIDRMTGCIRKSAQPWTRVARDVKSWLKLASQPASLDVSVERRSLRRKLATELSQHKVREQRNNDKHGAGRLQELFRHPLVPGDPPSP